MVTQHRLRLPICYFWFVRTPHVVDQPAGQREHIWWRRSTELLRQRGRVAEVPPRRGRRLRGSPDLAMWTWHSRMLWYGPSSSSNIWAGLESSMTLPESSVGCRRVHRLQSTAKTSRTMASSCASDKTSSLSISNSPEILVIMTMLSRIRGSRPSYWGTAKCQLQSWWFVPNALTLEESQT